jgi:hypothetical protein
MKSIPTIIFSLLVAVCAGAAPMARVSSIKNGGTLIIDGGTELRLAGIEVTNDGAARELLRWTLGTSWVMVERMPDGSALVYRSPDAMFINRELVLRGYARATLPGIEPTDRANVTYLGVVDPGPRSKTSKPASTSKAAPRTGSGKSARSPTSRATRAPRSPRADRDR